MRFLFLFNFLRVNRNKIVQEGWKKKVQIEENGRLKSYAKRERETGGGGGAKRNSR